MITASARRPSWRLEKAGPAAISGVARSNEVGSPGSAAAGRAHLAQTSARQRQFLAIIAEKSHAELQRHATRHRGQRFEESHRAEHYARHQPRDQSDSQGDVRDRRSPSVGSARRLLRRRRTERNLSARTRRTESADHRPPRVHPAAANPERQTQRPLILIDGKPTPARCAGDRGARDCATPVVPGAPGHAR